MAKGKKATAVADEAELEELESDTVEETPAKAGKKKENAVTFGASDLAKLLSEQTGKTITPRDLRAQIRRMAREENARVKREITPGNRTRYDWSGPDDPEVKAIIKAVTGGEMDQAKKEQLEKLKAQKAAKQAAKAEKGDGGKKGKKGKAAKAEAEPDAEELDDLDD